MNTLPNELVDCILDNLDPSIDRSTFLSCALVGKTWVGPSQRVIFHTISLQFPVGLLNHTFLPASRSDRVNSFLELNARLVASLEANPELASYVRCLYLREFVDGILTHDEWDAVCDSAAKVLRWLSTVKEVFFVWNCWDPLSPTLKMALIGILTPLVTKISLILFNMFAFVDMVSLLNHLTHLEVLTVLDSNCRDWDMSNHTGTNSPPPGSIHLRKLVLDNPDFMTWFQQGSCPFGLEKLQSLQISRNVIADYQIASMLQKIGDSLVKLKLKCPHDKSPCVFFQSFLSSFAQESLPALSEPGLVHIGYTPNLKCLELVDVFQSDSITPVPWLRSLLEPSKQCRHPLQYLSIELRVSKTTDSTWNHWTAFDQLLQNPEFDTLEIVHFKTTERK